MPFEPYVHYSLHLLLMIVVLYSTKVNLKSFDGVLALGAMLSGVLACGYVIFNYEAFQMRAGYPEGIEMLLGLILIITILDGTRRLVGWALPILVVIAFLYLFFGKYLSGYISHPGFDLDYCIGFLYLTVDGIWGVPLQVSSTILVMFILFGSFIEYSRLGDYFIQLAIRIAGRFKGGPAHVAVLSSALIGTINGSSVANVVTTGTFTIPLMKKYGYSNEFAGGVESAASTGGQIMPPIMGSGAFVMATILEIPYLSIAAACLLPAILYFMSIFFSIYFEANHLDLSAISLDYSLPGSRRSLLKEAYLLLPILVIVYCLLIGYSPPRAAFWAILTTVLIVFLRSKGKISVENLLGVLESGARSMLMVTLPLACAAILIGIINLTGIGIKLSSLIIMLSQNIYILGFLAAAVTSLVLGMGLPTVVAYMIAAGVVAPALRSLGAQPLVAHIFIFYYAVLAVITPPVCMAAYVASGIAKTSWFKIALVALKIATPAFVIPLSFIFYPDIIIVKNFYSTTFVFLFSLVGIFFLGAANIGFISSKISKIERLLFFLAGILCLWGSIETTIIGIPLGIVAVVSWKYRTKILITRF